MEKDPSTSTRKKIDHYSYRLNERIGKGYSSQVYRGRDDLTNEPVALKVIDLKGLKDAVSKEMLESETAILKELNHPNILKCLEVLKTSNHCYIITELWRGRRPGLLDQEEGQGFFEIGKLNILHRDLKPANIFLNEGVCKIADFGFAKKNSTPGMREKYNVGSPLYMSPESLKRNVYSTKNDIWSMGIILYEMLYGKTPWDCRSEKELIDKITRIPVSFPSSPRVSDDTKSLIRRCLDPEEHTRISLQEMQAHSALKGQERDRFRLGTDENQPPARETRSNSFLPPVRILGERSNNDRRKEHSVDPFAYKQSMNMSVTERTVKAPSMVGGNKENKGKPVMSKEQAIERINQCRLIYKLKEQLGDSSELAPQLRLELLTRITELHKESHSDRVRKVVDEYYNKYTTSVIGKAQHSVEMFEKKAMQVLWKCSLWARELLAAYLTAKRGRPEPLGKVLEGCGHLAEEDLRQQLRRAGLEA
ncbi:serine/threonine-protein kinase atg1-like [Hippocampus zosterae]|uniref:serine/threonine-protein kinase atg1-like n=1 Tax=Hippocampus zosterae TaxID=109293 RepID=UPI00223E5649|nr:serine/threonine-protein kinase atg1-like [Hippocampus zosterae]